tara:strand:- start:418 stop:549 length:132 start_codon:yes stop_codon:yes gene_type:complete
MMQALEAWVAQVEPQAVALVEAAAAQTWPAQVALAVAVNAECG